MPTHMCKCPSKLQLVNINVYQKYFTLSTLSQQPYKLKWRGITSLVLSSTLAEDVWCSKLLCTHYMLTDCQTGEWLVGMCQNLQSQSELYFVTFGVLPMLMSKFCE